MKRVIFQLIYSAKSMPDCILKAHNNYIEIHCHVIDATVFKTIVIQQDILVVIDNLLLY